MPASGAALPAELDATVASVSPPLPPTPPDCTSGRCLQITSAARVRALAEPWTLEAWAPAVSP